MISKMDFPAIDGRVVTEGHARVCREFGHATHTTNGVTSPICPRCREKATVKGDIGCPRCMRDDAEVENPDLLCDDHTEEEFGYTREELAREAADVREYNNEIMKGWNQR